MSDAQTIELIEVLERRVAHLEILEDPIRICRLINDISSDVDQNFTKQVATLWNGSEITLTLTEPGYLWWGYQFHTRNLTFSRALSLLAYVYIDGIQATLSLDQGHFAVGYRQAMAMLGRSGDILAAGDHTVDVRLSVFVVNDTVLAEHLQGYAFWTRA